MTIRSKVLLIILITFSILSIISYAISQYFVLKNSDIIENKNIESDILHLLTILEDEIAQMDAILEDWAAWDDTYQFIVDRNQYYIDSNLVDVTFTNLGIDVMLFLDNADRVVFAKRVDRTSGEEVSIPPQWSVLWEADTPLVGHADPTARVNGIVMLPEGPLLVASQPIVTSAGEGPIRGTLIIGRRLDAAEIARLAHKARLFLRVFPYNAETMPADVTRARAAWRNQEGVVVIPRGENLISGYTVLHDIFGDPALIIAIDAPRELRAQARLGLRTLALSVFGTGIGMLLITLMLLEGAVIRRLLRLERAIRWIAGQGGAASRVPDNGNDELSSLARGVNTMLAALAQAQTRLQADEECYRHISELISDYAYAFRVEEGNRLVREWVTDSFPRVTGYTSAEVDARGGWRALIHPDDMPIALAREMRLFAGETDVSEFRIVRKDGEVRWLRDHARPVWDAQQGRVVRIYGAAQDITERRESERRYRALFENVPEIVYALSPEGHFTLLNPAFTWITGWPVEAWLGRPFDELIHPDDRVLARTKFERALRDETQAFRALRVLNAAGDTLILEVLGVAQKQNGRITGVTGFAHDITARVRAEEAMGRHVRELEAVHRVSTALRIAQTLDEALGILLDETLDLLDSEAGIIRLYHPAAHELRTAVARGWFGERGELPLSPGEGIVGRVFSEGRPATIDDIAAAPHLPPAFRAKTPAGWRGAAVPIRSATTTEGVLLVGIPAPRRFNADELHLLEALAEMAGATIHRLRLHEETLRRVRQLEALQTIDRAITASLDLRVSLAILLEETVIQLNVDAAGVLLYHPHLNVLDYAADHGLRSPLYRHTRLRLGEGLTGLAALEHRLLVVPDLAHTDLPWGREGLQEAEGFVSYAVAPLVAKGQLQGVLEVFHRSPLRPDEDWLQFFQTLAQQASIAVDNARLFERLQRSHVELAIAYDATIEGWARALELRDRETEGHTRRVTEMTLALARAIGMEETELVHVRRGALLHDIGKMAIPDAILLKPAPLTPEEEAVMRRHPQYALEMLSPITYLQPALDIPYCHHERWDGSGYPRGLKGTAIPLAARLFAVADVFDALTSERPYRRAWSREEALDYLRQQAGRQFDPEVVALFLQMAQEGKW
mgnify:CR=1 FL=1